MTSTLLIIFIASLLLGAFYFQLISGYVIEFKKLVQQNTRIQKKITNSVNIFVEQNNKIIKLNEKITSLNEIYNKPDDEEILN